MSEERPDITESLRDAAIHPDQWDVPGLMLDAVDEIWRLRGDCAGLESAALGFAFMDSLRASEKEASHEAQN